MEEEKKDLATIRGNSPAEMIRIAIDGKADLDKLEKLLALQERWEANEAKKAYVKAMAAFKADPPKILKDKKVAFKEVNYSHASLGNVSSEINSALSQHGLSATWKTRQTDKMICVTCKITHVQGYSEETELCAGADATGSKNSIQAIGSTVTYLERYTILSLTGLATHDGDDDGRGGKTQDSNPAEYYISAPQIAILENYIAKSKSNLNNFLKAFKIDSICRLQAKDYQKAISVFKNWEKTQAQKPASDPGTETVIDVDADKTDTKNSPFSPSDSAKITTDQQKEEIGQMLFDLADGDDSQCSQLLKEFTAFKKKDGTEFAGHTSFERITPLAMKATHGRVKKAWKEKEFCDKSAAQADYLL